MGQSIEQSELAMKTARNKAIRKSIKQRYREHIEKWKRNPHRYSPPQDWTPDPEITDQDLWESEQFLEARREFVSAHTGRIADAAKQEVNDERSQARAEAEHRRRENAAIRSGVRSELEEMGAQFFHQ